MNKPSQTKAQRIPSPLTYISNYNKVCLEEIEQTKQCLPIDRKHETLFLWNDNYVALNRIKVPNVMQERKIRRKLFQTAITINNNNINGQNNQTNINNPTSSNLQQQPAKQTQGQNQASNLNNNNNNNNNNPASTDSSLDEGYEMHTDNFKSFKQLHEKEEERFISERTKMLERLMELNSESEKKLHASKGQEGFGQAQRKYFSNTKQQMQELQNHILSSSKMSREIMDRKGLSLRKVLASISQEKLIQIIEYKQNHFFKIMNEKNIPKKEFRLNSQIHPRFTAEHNYDYQKIHHNQSQSQNSKDQNNSFLRHLLSTGSPHKSKTKQNEIQTQPTLNKSASVFMPPSGTMGAPHERKRLSIIETNRFARANRPSDYNNTSNPFISNNKVRENSIQIQFPHHLQTQHSKNYQSGKIDNNKVNNNNQHYKYAGNTRKLNQSGQAAESEVDNKSNQMQVNEDGLYYYEGLDDLLIGCGGALNTQHRMAETNAENGNQSQNNLKGKKIIQQNQQPAGLGKITSGNINPNEQQDEKEMRVRAEGEVHQTIDKLQEIQQYPQVQQNHFQQHIHSPSNPHAVSATASTINSQLKSPSNLISNNYMHGQSSMNGEGIKKNPLQKLFQSQQQLDYHGDALKLKTPQITKDPVPSINTNNFFNYSSYFYNKYSKRNNGLSTKLSRSAMEGNSNFQLELQHLIDLVDQDIIQNGTQQEIPTTLKEQSNKNKINKE